MITTRTKRGLSSIAAAAMVLSGASLALAAPANADTGITYVTADDVASTEASYLGWHEGYTNSPDAFSVEADGLHLGDGADSQIINGLVATGAPGKATTAADLGAMIAGAQADVVSGDVYLQVAVTVNGGGVGNYGTLRPAVPVASDVTPDLGDEWVSSKSIGSTVTANTPMPLVDLLGALEAQSDLRYSAFGVLALASAPAVVANITWAGTTYAFTPEPAPMLEESDSTLPAEGDEVAAGDTFTFTASGFTPSSKVDVNLHSDPIFLDSFTSDTTGVVTGTVTIPNDAPAGTHQIVLTDVVSGATVSSASFTIPAAVTAPPVVTPAPVASPVIVKGFPAKGDKVVVGSSFTFTATGFTPNGKVQLGYGTGESGGEFGDPFTADAQGVVTGTITIPASWAPGDFYSLGLVDVTTGGFVNVGPFSVVLKAAVSNTSATTSTGAAELASTGFDGPTGIALAGLLLLAGLGIGAGRLVVSRRKA